MVETTRKLKVILNYCKTHKDEKFPECSKCVIKRNCINSTKRARYNDPRFLDKSFHKVERAIGKEMMEEGNDPFVEVQKT